MSISQTLNNTPNSGKKNFDTILNQQRIKSFVGQNLTTIIKYWPLAIISQMPLAYIAFGDKINSKKPLTHSKVEAKNLDIKDKKHYEQLEKRLKSLNERFLVLQTQHAKIVKAIIAIQEKQQINSENNSPSAVKNSKHNISAFEVFEKIGEKIKLGESYSHLLLTIPNDLKSSSSYEALKQYANKAPPTFNDLIKAFSEIQKDYTPNQYSQAVPAWLEKIAEFFKGKVKISKGDVIEHSPIEAIKEALELHDFQLAADAAQYADNASIKKWGTLLEERLQLEHNYILFGEQISNITLEKKENN
jgi:hypothetical protein